MDPSRRVRLIFLGAPGVGKGTQSNLLQTRLGLLPLSSGMIFRGEIEAQTDLGRLAQSYIQHGQLVPNGVTIEMMFKRLRSDEVRKHGFILDGFPRTLRQAVALDELLAEMETPLTEVIELSVADDILMSRLSGRLGCTKCGEIYHSVTKPPLREGLCDRCNSPLFVRSDDKPEAIRERLKVFHETIEPLRQFYAKEGLLATLEAGDDPEELYQRIVQTIGMA